MRASVAQADPPPEPSLFSEAALARMTSGLDAQIGVGYHGFGDTSSHAFYKPASDSRTPVQKVSNVFGGGPSLTLGVDYRLLSNFAIGVEGEWASQGAGSGATLTDPQNGLTEKASNITDHRYAVFLRVLFGDPDSRVNGFMDFNLGLGSFSERFTTTTTAPAGAGFVTDVNIGAATAGAKLGLDVRFLPMVPGLRVGAFVGFNLWLPTSRCQTVTQASIAGTENCDDNAFDTNSNFGYTAGLALRYTLPLTLEPPPPQAEFVLVTSSLQVSTSESTLPEVTDTPAYRAEQPQVRQVALQAPTECASETAANRTGQAAATGNVLKTFCGVEMGELERALTKQGYIVQSWSTLAAMVREQQITPVQAATKMGAQVLFQVNSLEHVKAEASSGAHWERRYFQSDAMGGRGAPANLLERDRDALRELLAQPETTALTGSRSGAMLDVNAILTSTGQTIWFYRWQKLDTSSQRTAVQVEARRYDNGPWARYEPQLPPEARTPAVEDRRSVESGDQHSSGGPENTQDALYFRLMREVVTDFVTRFTHPGQPAMPGLNLAPAPAPAPTAQPAPATQPAPALTPPPLVPHTRE